MDLWMPTDAADEDAGVVGRQRAVSGRPWWRWERNAEVAS